MGLHSTVSMEDEVYNNKMVGLRMNPCIERIDTDHNVKTSERIQISQIVMYMNELEVVGIIACNIR